MLESRTTGTATDARRLVRPVVVEAPPAPVARWSVLHTRPRQEKALARMLHAANIEHELPLARHVTFHGHRRRVVDTPLFPSYLFMRGPAEATWFARASRRVANVIPIDDQARFLHELTQIRLALESGADLLADDYLAVGRRVRVRSGPFRDIEGLIETRSRSGRLVLQVEALGRATSLEIDTSLLEPVD